MSNLIVDQKKVKDLFQEKKVEFLIPDYQRPYAWGEQHCRTLWDDLFNFAFPDDNNENFNDEDEYFLGPIVTFRNKQRQLEVIDGQQRLTTLMLLLRAFYNKLKIQKDQHSIGMKKEIERCLWKTDMHGDFDINQMKISSEVATENDSEEFSKILRDGKAEGMKSLYAKNFRYFEGKVEDFLQHHIVTFANFPGIILYNCVLLPIEADSQDTALRIFSTLNDRGKQLSDADIFKAQFYKRYKDAGKKDWFIEKWKDLDLQANRVFKPIYGTPMDELFTRYMYYERALQGNKSSTTEALRKFYERNDYEILKREDTLANLITLANFWEDVANQDSERFSKRVLRQLFVLNYAPNGMWTYIVSVYFMHNKDSEGNLDDEKFFAFLNRITAFIFAYALTNPGVNSLRTPLFEEMINIVTNREVEFAKYLFDESRFRSVFSNYLFTNARAVTKSYITWWAFQFEDQPLLNIEQSYDIEHIFSKARQQKDNSLKDTSSLELLGNKSLLERRINIRASDYRFIDKKKYYNGFITSKGEKKATGLVELIRLAEDQQDFAESDIIERNNQILDCFVDYLGANNLLLEKQS